jgi:hypothetical protein
VIGDVRAGSALRGIPETHLEFHDVAIHKSMLVVPPGGLPQHRPSSNATQVSGGGS